MLYKNQLPLIDFYNGCCDVFFVGLSAKKVNNILEDVPLSSDTTSGRLILEIEKDFLNLSFYHTNLVKCLPIDFNSNKIRYPLKHEKKACIDNLFTEILLLKPKIVFLLGCEVINTIFDKYKQKKKNCLTNFNYKVLEINDIKFVGIHHPSYISVYDKKNKAKYIESIKKEIKKVI